MKCNLCETDEAAEKHHVIPRSKGGKETIPCCSDCGGQVHMLFNNKELADMSVDELKEKLADYIKWKKKHPGNHTHRASKKVKDWLKYHR